MEYDKFENHDGVEVRIPKTQDYRTCSECGGDCEPDISFGSDESGARIAFVCPEHGVNAMVDPFEDQR